MTTDSPAPPPVSRASITEDQVFAVAQALMDSGVRPTSAKIRERLGKGSATTIQAMLERWRERRASAAPAPIPANLVDQAKARGAEASQRLLEALWGPIRDQVAREYDAQIKELQLRAQEYHDDLQDATENVVALETKLADVTAHNDTLAGLNGDLTAQVRGLEQHNRDLAIAVRESTAASQKASEEAGIQTTRAHDAEAALASALSSIDAAKRESSQKGADLMRLREEHAGLQQKTAAHASDQQKRIDQLAGEAGAHQVTIARLQEQVEAAAKRDEELGPIVREFGILRRRNDDLSRRLALLDKDNPTISGFIQLLRKQTKPVRQSTLEDMLSSHLPMLPTHQDMLPLIGFNAPLDLALDTFTVLADEIVLSETNVLIPITFSFAGDRTSSAYAGRTLIGRAVMTVDDFGLVSFSDIKASFEK
jgi:predicted  nucleic acid-binding Zn-ribbon protein